MSRKERFRRGDERADGLRFWAYQPSYKSGERWVTADKFDELVAKEKQKRQGSRYRLYIRNYNHRVRYGITQTKYQSLLNSQNNRCLLCGTKFDSNSKPHVDHCHASGRVRGLLCNPCNTMLGFAKDNPKTLANAISYLSS